MFGVEGFRVRSTVLALVILAAGCSARHPPDVPPLPAPLEVERITATVSGSVSGEPDLAEFELPTEFVPEVLAILGSPDYHKHPPAKHTREVGHLWLAHRDGQVTEVGLVFSGKEPALFTLQGVPCIRSGPYNDMSPGHARYLPEVLTLEGFLRAAQRGDRAAARGYLDLLHRSAGRVNFVDSPRRHP